MCMTIWKFWVYSSNPAAYLMAAATNGNLANDLSPSNSIIFLLYAALLLVVVYSILADYAGIFVDYGRFTSRFTVTLRFRHTVKTPIEIDSSTWDVTAMANETASHRKRNPIDRTRGDRQPTSKVNSVATKQSYSIKSFDDGTSRNENTFGTSGYVTANYSDLSYRSTIVGGGTGLPRLTRSMIQGTESVSDKGYDVHRHTVKNLKPSQDASTRDDHYRDPNLRGIPHDADFSDFNPSTLKIQNPPSKRNIQQKDLDSDLEVSQQVQRELETQHSNDFSKWQKINQPTKPSSPSSLPEPKKGYNKSSYAVLIGDSVKVYSTNIFAALPSNNKFLVKERHQDLSGVTRVKLTLKSTEKERYIATYIWH